MVLMYENLKFVKSNISMKTHSWYDYVLSTLAC